MADSKSQNVNIILLGPPGSGKGTQATLLKEKFKFHHISTGDLIRNEIDNDTILGKKLKEFAVKGLLVPDPLVIEILKNKIEDLYHHLHPSLLLDGFPRTIEQHKELELILKNYDEKINYAFYFKIEENIVVKRLSGRRLCPKCKVIYHIETKPSKLGQLCEQCKEILIQREDDKELTIRKRITEYNIKTTPLLQLYKDLNILIEVDANNKPDEIFQFISNILNPKS